MFLLARNALLLKITAPAVPADPGKGISGSGPVDRWTGNLDAYLDEDIGNFVRQQSVISMSHATGGLEAAGNTVIHVPQNIPVWPNLEDLVTVQRLSVMPAGASADFSATQTFRVRLIDTGLVQQGRLLLHCVIS